MSNCGNRSSVGYLGLSKMRAFLQLVSAPLNPISTNCRTFWEEPPTMWAHAVTDDERRTKITWSFRIFFLKQSKYQGFYHYFVISLQKKMLLFIENTWFIRPPIITDHMYSSIYFFYLFQLRWSSAVRVVSLFTLRQLKRLVTGNQKRLSRNPRGLAWGWRATR